MVGLVVIVILITLGMLFMAQFALKADNQKKIFTRKGLAYSTTSALMKTTVQAEGCNGLELGADILEDCVENWQSPDFQLTCGRARLASCEFFDNLITHLLEETLGTWNKNYEFRVRLVEMAGEEPEELITIPNENGGGCSKKERDSSGLFPLHIGSGLIESELFICD